MVRDEFEKVQWAINAMALLCLLIALWNG